MLKVGSVTSEESNSLKFKAKRFQLNFDWENFVFSDFEDFTSFPELVQRLKLKLTWVEDSLFLDLNYNRQLINLDSKLVILFSELFSDFKDVLERHPHLTEIPLLEEKELSQEETTKFLSSFNSQNFQGDLKEVQHSDLLPELRPYQEDAVRWLIQRETNKEEFIEEPFETLHSRYTNETFYINLLSLQIYPVQPYKCLLPSGGILADEMGMGKTVEMLALFLHHPNPNIIKDMPDILNDQDELPLKRLKYVRCICGKDRKRRKKLIECLSCGTSSHLKCVAGKSFEKTLENYICPECWELQETLLDSKTTLIVSPKSIMAQWKSEIKRHISNDWKILIYEKIHDHFYISPLDLVQYDIVIIDFSVLRSELYFDIDNSCRMNRRNESRTMRLLSPLTKINWWRICMDEAQMVSSVKTKTYQMVDKLSCVNKWAVSGTPIHKSIDDLLVHMNLFNLSPLSGAKNFQRLVFDYRNGTNMILVEYLQKLMWRTSKDQVKDQLNLPENNEVVHFVSFSNIMSFFYDEQRQKYTDQFFKEATYIKGTLVKDIDRHRMIKIITPLKLLRQSCTCPVIHNTTMKAKDSNVRNQMVEPKELSKHLISTNEIGVKIQLRAVVSSYNGLAGLYFLKNQYHEAIKIYKFVLNLAKQYSEKISVDSLLQIHAIHNMTAAYSMAEEEIDLTEYKDQINSISLKYLKEKSELAILTKKAYEETNFEIKKTYKEINTSELTKVVAASIDWVDQDSEIFMKRINDELSNPAHQNQRNRKYDVITSTRGLLYILSGWLDRLEKERSQMLKIISKMAVIEITDAIDETKKAKIDLFSQQVFNCHLDAKKNKRKKPPKCLLCNATDIFEGYEKVLYNNLFPLGTHIASLEEVLLKLITSHLRSTSIPKEDLKVCEKSLEIITLFKKELADANKFWIELDFSVKAYDELNMCKLRLQIVDKADEDIDIEEDDVDVTAIYEIGRYELDDRLKQQQMELNMENKELTKKLGRLKYVKHIENTTNPGSCPICMTDPDQKYVFLLCGHHICLMCFGRFEAFNKRTLQCAICREECRFDEVYFVSCKQATNPQDEPICGKFTSKVESIIQTILKIKKEDETSKILIFSEWESILAVLTNALDLNSISFRFKCTPKNLEDFKNPALDVTCFLLTVDQGSKGLNLTEANHVIFVEPLLNRGDKLQAIGRVHRMGQTRPTTIHHFIVHNTIEEKIYQMTKDKDLAQFKDMSVDDLKKLFSMDS